MMKNKNMYDSNPENHSRIMRELLAVFEKSSVRLSRKMTKIIIFYKYKTGLIDDLDYLDAVDDYLDSKMVIIHGKSK